MDFPLLAAQILSDGSPMTIGLSVGLGAAFLAYGEARVHISGLREKEKAHEAQIRALEQRLGAAEVREGRTLERLDYFTARLDRIDVKLDRILDQQKGVA